MISHDRRCIFTHVPKTAGKSIRYLFGLPEFEKDYRGDCNDIEYAFGHRPLAEFIEQEYFTSYFKFAFVRNPFDRIVSAYFYLDNGGCNELDRNFRDEYLAPYRGNFPAFVEDLSRLASVPHFQPQVSWLCDGRRNLLADFIGRYENLAQDVSIVGERLGFSVRKLPVLNTSKHSHYSTHYDDATKRRVAQVYGEDIEFFSYQFE